MKLAFTDCVLDLTTRQLWRAGTLMALEPKMYKLLEILIKRRPAVLANEELDELLWPHVFVARTSLTRLVSAVRSVLGDVSRDSQIIRTSYKTGYAFCAKVTILDEAAPSLVRTATAMHVVWHERRIALTEGEHIAGRGEECSLCIDATTVSRRHAKIVVSNRSITIEDLQSTNGTHVNGVQITSPTPLVDGSRVELGSEVLLVRTRDASALTVRIDSGAHR